MGVEQFMRATIDGAKQITLYLNADDIKMNMTIDVVGYTIKEIRKEPTKWFVYTNEPFDLTKPVTIDYSCKEKQLTHQIETEFGVIVSSDYFDEQFAYQGELGALYSFDKTVFKLWAPTAKKVELLLDEQVFVMEKTEKGVFCYTHLADCLNQTYMYRLTFQDAVHEVVDPYAKGVTLNGEKGVVVHLDKYTDYFKAAKYPIIYELHVRDASIHASSGIANKGQFIGLTQAHTKSHKGQATGLSYLKQLGITHVQLLPISDYSSQSVDESDPLASYNWGYDPLHFNVPEGSYSTNPNDPMTRIREFRQLVQAFHQQQLAVIMDVVYNHVYHINEHSFDKIVPGYYFRRDEFGALTDGTGVGNDFASERFMARKYIVDSVVHWLEYYQVDGFRFDLMGMLDIDTMQAVEKAVHAINPNAFILGEGWNMGTLPDYQKAAQINVDRLQGIACFNDTIRDALKGSMWGTIQAGFVSGAPYLENRVINNVLGIAYPHPYQKPSQVIQYVEAHDNYTLYDQLVLTNGYETEEIRIKRQLLANSILLTSFGVPFIHAGQEFMRTKQGVENSYCSPDTINALDWDRAYHYRFFVDKMKELISLRKALTFFHINDFNQIRSMARIIKQEHHVIVYEIHTKDAVFIICYSAHSQEQTVYLSIGTYDVLFTTEEQVKRKWIVTPAGMNIPPISACVLKKKN